MNDHTRRDFLQALGITPLLALLLAADKPPVPVASPAPPDPEESLKELRAFTLPDGVEPAAVFVPIRGNR